MISTLVGLVCMILFFLSQFGLLEKKSADPMTSENNALGVGLVDILRTNKINNMNEYPFFAMERSELVEKVVQTMLEGGYADVNLYVAADQEYEDLDSFLYDYNFDDETAPVIIIKGDFSADAIEGYRGQVIVIGNKPAGLNNALVVITPNGNEEVLSKNPKKAFKEMYTVE